MNIIAKTKQKIDMQTRINTLELENETLRNTIKDNLYDRFMRKLDETSELDRYILENKRLRKQINVLKQMIRDGYEQKDGMRNGKKRKISKNNK